MPFLDHSIISNIIIVLLIPVRRGSDGGFVRDLMEDCPLLRQLDPGPYPGSQCLFRS